MPFGCGACDQLDLPFVESEALIGRARLRLDRPVVGEQDSLRAAFDDGGGNRTVGDIGEALRREYDRDILLAQHLEPFADTGGDKRIVEEHPSFKEAEHGRASLDPLYTPVNKGEQTRTQKKN